MAKLSKNKEVTRIIVGGEKYGKTLSIAQFIVDSDDISDDYTIPEYLGDWAIYFFVNKPITKADLREALYGIPDMVN